MKTPDRLTDEQRWTAVLRRDSAADGAFVYSVKSTGIYCLPSCPSRTARRENVAFHDTCADAEKAGFRPCKRCRPQGGTSRARQAAAVTAACRRIEAAEEVPDLDTLAAQAGLSRFHFHRVFKRLTGLTPKAYAAAHRAERIRGGLPGCRTVTEALYEAGFQSNGRFYAESARLLGMKPEIFRRGGPGEIIRFAIGACSLGAILVASSEKGICSILIGDDPEALASDLQDRFPKAEIIGDDSGFEETVAKVVGFVEAPGIGLDLPLDIRGTAFQQRVWQALQEIPAGSTATYTEIARKLGAPEAVRAVAGACAANRIAVAVPCHRVVRTDGGLAGYRWGVARKRELLRREANE